MAGKDNPKTGGRKKGASNKVTKDVKEMILAALDKKGGVEYLQQQADDNPVAFLTLVGKVLPLTVKGDLNMKHMVKVIDLSGSDGDD